MKALLAIFFVFAFTSLWAQDTPKELTLDEFAALVKSGHPIARQAQLQLELGQLQLLKAKGGADPKAFTELNQKQYTGKEYYSILDAGLTIPTWYAVSFEAGFEQNRGSYLNPENTTPATGLYHAGASLPLGKGLFIDERRAALRQAELFSQLTEAEQRQLLNDLLLDAGAAYWRWFRAYNNLKVFEDANKLAQQRFTAVKMGASLGDRPAIDTLEAGIQVQTRQVQLESAKLEVKNAQAYMEVFLWQDGQIPLELDDETIPQEKESLIYATEITSFLTNDSLILNHPEYAQALLKLKSLEIDNRLKKEQLKPQLDLKYNAISGFTGTADDALGFDNYTWGLKFSMPIFLRKERGDLRINKVKIEQTQRALDQKQATLNLKVEMSFNEWQTTTELINIQQNTVRDYKDLLAGERALFNQGESSLFMVNSREMNYIQSQVKLNDLVGKRFESELKVKHALGILTDTF